MNQIPKERDRPYVTSEPNALGDVLSRLFALKGYGRVRAEQQLHEAWVAVAGQQVAALTRVAGLKNGVLQVGVANSALLSELASFQKTELLQGLEANYSHLKIRDVRFRLRGDLV